MGLLCRLYGRHESVQVIFPHFRRNQVINRSHSILEGLQVLHLVDLHSGLLDDLKIGLFLLDLGRSVPGARDLEALIQRFLDLGRLPLVLLEVHGPGIGG